MPRPIAKEDLIIDKRGRTPIDLPRTECDIPLSFHHVIPLRVLKTIFNYLLNAELDKSTEEKLQNTFIIFLRATGCNKLLIDNFHSCIVAARTSGEIEVSEIFDPADIIELVHKNATWPRWNLVEGPTDKADDPGEAKKDYGFDRLGLIRGLSKRHQCLYEKLRIINASFARFIEKLEKGEAIYHADIRSLTAAITHLYRATSASNLSLVAFDPRHWDAAPDSPGQHIISPKRTFSRADIAITASASTSKSSPPLRSLSPSPTRNFKVITSSREGFFARREALPLTKLEAEEAAKAASASASASTRPSQ